MHRKNKIDLKKLHKVLTKVVQKHKKYKSTFLIKQGESLVPIEVKNFAFFNIKSGIVKGTTFNKDTIIITNSMSDLEAALNPTQFYRINRQFIVQRNAISSINYSFNKKLTVIICPKYDEPIVISNAKSKAFKLWMSK